MNNEKVIGIVLAVFDYREKDAIVKVLTETDGVVSFLGKGVKKINSKLRNYLQIGAKICIYCRSINTNNLNVIYNVDLIEIKYNLYDNLKKQAILNVMCELFVNIECDNELFFLFEDLLRELECLKNPLIVLCFAFSRLNKKLGTSPCVDSCVLCGSQSQIVSFSPKHGGFVCLNCNQKVHANPLTKDTLKSIRYIVKANSDNLLELQAYEYNQQIVNLLYDVLYQYQGIRLHAMQVVFEIFHFLT